MISTGLQKLDDFLSGGISPGLIVDIFGANGTGKTLLLLQLSANCIKRGGNVLYVDTTGGFRPERILEIEKNSDVKSDLLKKITVSRVTNTSEQINVLDNFNSDQFSLIVIDNITDLFSYEYQNDELLFKKNSIFMKYMNRLSEIAISKKIPIVITNMIRNIEEKEIENMKNAISPFTHIKIHLVKKSSKFSGKVVWALDEQFFSYEIRESGLSDSTEDI